MGIRSEGFNAEQSLWLETLCHVAALTSSRTFEMKSSQIMWIIRVDHGNTVTAERGLPRNSQQLRKSLSLPMGRFSTKGAKLS